MAVGKVLAKAAAGATAPRSGSRVIPTIYL